MLGTAGNLIMPLATPDFDTRLINSHHVGCDRYLALEGELEDGADIGFVGLEFVGAGAIRVAHRVGLLLGVVVLRFNDAVRHAPRLAHHADLGH